ncbi:Sigma-54 dependent transcriptional regulator-response regulator protein [Salinisphaera shabanensis E1L3A]|uniref:Sigma-54 dependent transcriptional regulator-response regulator protein n=1 Tax=Salinisphaera shabanensis E1L3A TaxID=1033802 RepID=U2G017_9GAMM|nr:sigma-54 dependent transcriptional regulator [Salinisphaera shabanensis]ERJ19673.1 Sigma-54 dependent transcriptional regulator-response regulator protein [Salinisphaera shabanensis E1L3A]
MSAAHILLLEDEGALARALDRRLRRDGYTVAVCENIANAKLAARRRRPDLALLDLRLPDGYGLDFLEWLRGEIPNIPAVVMTAFGELDDAIAAMRLGAVDFLKKPLDLEALHRVVADALARETPATRVANDAAAAPEDTGLVGDSPAMRALYAQLDRIAALAAGEAPPNVLLTGETGTGKDRVARMLHARSTRAKNPFVQVDCAALPRDLVEAELFGHEKGAFTNAHRARRGLLAAAGDGTAFLNEIGELPMALQAKLLTALESRTVREIGGDTERDISAWFVAATNRDLAEMMATGDFRQDLYYRLNVLTLHLPPLRERGDDVIALAEHFVAHTAARYDRPVPTIDENARAAIRTYHWPGNVRELRHVVERAVLVHAEHVVEATHLQLPAALSAPAQRESTDRATDNAANTTLADSERDLIERTLHQTQHNVSQAARQLGLSRGALRYRLEKYGLDGG